MNQRTVVIEFASVASAIAAYDSPDYQAARKLLGGTVVRDIRIVEGTEWRRPELLSDQTFNNDRTRFDRSAPGRVSGLRWFALGSRHSAGQDLSGGSAPKAVVARLPGRCGKRTFAVIAACLLLIADTIIIPHWRDSRLRVTEFSRTLHETSRLTLRECGHPRLADLGQTRPPAPFGSSDRSAVHSPYRLVRAVRRQAFGQPRLPRTGRHFGSDTHSS